MHISHLWDTFHGLIPFGYISADFSERYTAFLVTEDCRISQFIRKAFQGVTPSFHLSEY